MFSSVSSASSSFCRRYVPEFKKVCQLQGVVWTMHCAISIDSQCNQALKEVLFAASSPLSQYPGVSFYTKRIMNQADCFFFSQPRLNTYWKEWNICFFPKRKISRNQMIPWRFEPGKTKVQGLFIKPLSVNGLNWSFVSLLWYIPGHSKVTPFLGQCLHIWYLLVPRL